MSEDFDPLDLIENMDYKESAMSVYDFLISKGVKPDMAKDISDQRKRNQDELLNYVMGIGRIPGTATGYRIKPKVVK